MPLPTIPSGNVASALPSGFDVANSCRFNSADSPHLQKTGSTPSSEKTFTFSCWLKRVKTGVDEHIFDTFNDSSNRSQISFASTDVMDIRFRVSNSNIGRLVTNRKFRDLSAWYSIVVRVDTTQSTSGDRLRLYINGIEETSFSTETQPSEDADTDVTGSITMGAYDNGGSEANFFQGYLAEVVYCDGQSYAPTEFGEYDSDSPSIWKPKNVSGLTFGNNGFYLDFQSSGNLGNDANGGTDLNENNIVAADQATDTPTNNFATMNPLDNIGGTTFSEGNNKLLWTANNKTNKSTIGVTAGKWYAECKAIDVNGGTSGTLIGVGGPEALASTYLNGAHVSGWGYRVQTGNIQNLAGNEAYGDTWSENDIIGVALDMDNGAVYMSKNGTWQDSGDPTSGASKTNAANNQPSYGSAISGTMFFACSSYDTDSLAWNFGGCPAFSISSGNADANGYGNFEYAPPSGFYSLCTKNLAEFGG